MELIEQPIELKTCNERGECTISFVQPFSCSTSVTPTYNCLICSFKTPLFLSLNNHLQQTHQNCKSAFDGYYERLECLLCEFKTYSLFLLLRHASQYHSQQLENGSFKNGKWFECGQCPHQSLQLSSLWIHVDAKHDDFGSGQKSRREKKSVLKRRKPYKCRNLLEQLYEPTKIVLKTYNERCECTISFIQPFSCSTSDTPTYNCLICSFKTPFFLSLNNHLQQTHRNCKSAFGSYYESLECLVCEFKTYSLLLLLRHAVKFHCQQVKNGSFKNNRWFECGRCPYRSIQLSSLWIHIYAKHDEFGNAQKYYNCEERKAWLKKKSDLKKRKPYKCQILSINKMWHCDYCPFKVPVLHKLRKHVWQFHKMPFILNNNQFR